MPARHDLTTDPELRAQLLTVRRGTAFFSRIANNLSDSDFDGPTLLEGWTRRHLIAHVGYNARAITRLVQWANTGVETLMYSSPGARDEEIEFGSTLPVRALRNLNDHAAISLDVEWRDTPETKWDFQVRTAQGREVPLRETVWMRTREVWLHAVDLDNGATFADIPREVALRLLADITGAWKKRDTSDGLSVTVTDAPEVGFDSGGRHAVSGSLYAVLAWASGRTSQHLDQGSEVSAPRWI